MSFGVTFTGFTLDEVNRVSSNPSQEFMDALNIAFGGNVEQYITSAEIMEGENGGVLVTYTIGSHLLSDVQASDFHNNLENGMRAQPGLGLLYSITLVFFFIQNVGL